MKRLIILTCSLFSVLAFSQCANKILDIKDLGSYSPGQVWSDPKLADAYLTNLYTRAFSAWGFDGNLSDECIGILGKDAIQPNKGGFKIWPYTDVYKINTLLEEIDGGTLKPEIKDPIKAQALFLRAYAYFAALRVHGGIPYVKKVQQKEDPDLNVPRNSSLECFDFIIADLDAAIAGLPDRYESGNYGRVDGSFALAFKAKVLLYKASPQFNPANPYGNAYVEEAYLANKLAYETLKARGYKLFDDYGKLFTTDKNCEAVFAIVYSDPLKTNARQNDTCRPLSMSKNSTGGDQAVWNLIKDYPMKDGKKPGESSYSHDVQTYWQNRDPRFEASQVWNGSLYELSGITGRRQYTVELLCHKDDGFYNGAGHGRTGIFPRKGMDTALPVAQVTMSGMDYSVMRFAEVMFNYAEIACSKGITDVGYDVLKEIRKRAGIEPGVDEMYGLKTGMSASEMRETLIEEKRFEFVFEGQRFFDLARNRMFSKIDGIRKYGILGAYKGTITDQTIADANAFKLKPEDFSYTVQETFGDGEKIMSVPDTYYFFPISQGSIDSNPKIEQNKAWGGTFVPELQ